MARRNGVWFEGRLINKTGQSKLSKARTGRRVLELLVAEDFRSKNSAAPDSKKDPAKGPDDYVTVATAWHRIRVFDGKEPNAEFEKLIRDPRFNHGAVIVVDASYEEDSTPWIDKQGVTRTSRPESIYFGVEDGGSIGFKNIDGNGKTFGASEGFERPFWDGVSELPAMGGSGGNVPAPDYSENEGF